MPFGPPLTREEQEQLAQAGATRSYEEMWRFWLDDACYRVARGVRYLDIPSEVSGKTWAEEIHPRIYDIEKEHGVAIRAVGDEEGVEIQVARYRWVFDLLDLAGRKGGWLEDAMIGVLLGYDADKIEAFLASPVTLTEKGRGA